MMKPVDKKTNPGLAKLPKKVRNKMGYMKNGGKATKKPVRMASGGESKKIGLTPAQVSKKFDALEKGRLSPAQLMKFIMGKIK
jgi:hypothetical protein